MIPQNLLRNMRKINAKRVIIESDELIVLEDPEVYKVTVMGKQLYNVVGKERKISEDDIKLVMEKANVDRQKAIEALLETGDVVEAITLLTE